ncbi:MAG: hypothetical protein LH472_04860 [Pyrinomonadaceae bacterium]|nr:hypothetical protein [Pyrinomonadaceae bacterium]
MMNRFFRRGANEYRRQISLKDLFARQTERLKTIIESSDWKNPIASSAESEVLTARLLLLLAPLIEIAWADGKITRRESDAILEVAAKYGLADNQTEYSELLNKLTARPIPQIVERMWQDFYYFFEGLSEPEREEVKFCVRVQAQFVAEQSSNNLITFLRGERVSQTERKFLNIIFEQMENAHTAAQSLEDERKAIQTAESNASEMSEITVAADNYYGRADFDETLDDYSKLIPLVPLVKTAWAEGRVTKRERHLVFEAANRFGIKEGTPAHRRLGEWLELPPTEEFFDSGLDILRGRWQKLDAEEKDRRRFELFDDCTRIAEASGGTSNFPSGGVKICAEEIATVKHIARKLDAAATG